MKSRHTGICAAFLIAGTLLTSCGKSSDSSHSKVEAQQAQGYSQSWDESQRQNSPSYSSYSSYDTPTFAGYHCTIDCSGHEAGYQWAEDNNIDDPDDCDGNSNSFIEGCEAYAEERQAELAENMEYDEIEY